MAEYAKFRYYLEKHYVLPLDIKNDIIYCQRAMRDFLKVHGLVSDVFKEQADADPVQMRRILEELEDEVCEINAEQQYLLLRLNDDLDMFLRKLQEKNIASIPDLVNEFVSSQIVPLISDITYQIHPHSVVSRDNEEMLIRKHFLLSQDEEAGVPPLKLSDLDESIPLVLAPPVVGLGQQIAAVQPLMHWPQLEHPIPLPPPPSHKSQSDMQRSLLINRIDVEAIPIKRKNITCTSPPPLAPITKTAVVVATVPAAQSNPPVDFEVVAQSRKNLQQALKRARKTKQQPRLCEEDLELSTEGAKRARKSPPLENVTNQNQTQNANANGKKSQVPSNQVPSQGPQKNSYKTRNTRRKSSPPPANSQAPTGGSPSGGSSDDSSAELQQEQQRLFASAAQWRDEPRESRIMPTEYGQEPFLRLFGLYTPEVLKKLNQRHSKRKRRTVQNASGVDFHYGQQLSSMDNLVLGIRGHKKCKEKPEFLLSPKEKRLQAVSKRAYNRKSKSPDKITITVTAMPPGSGSGAGYTACQHGEISSFKCRKCRECKVCKRKVEKDSMACHFCGGFYHLDCHEPTKIRHHVQLQHSRCPSCLRAQVDKSRDKDTK
ncbi:uncharacterized protein Dana_GF22586 [Drosophila ananassae]|uniref:PHD-type domain-containing protein n=1 Tax=Drosophila ananassae TaxID=7217 RepID=B3MVY0_DROAN|nr:uncharacterized protein LOC6505243 [Drosophila ananassae]EDV35125.1 uncharacterized protein Dana_GF22586 [Drosophila ananassae]